ncbi:MAG: hypothetical protein ACOC5U_04880 [Candidatus Aminicenantaceae bacterium]
MKELEKLRHVDEVEAPPGFEARVLSRLYERKAQRKKTRTIQLSLAGAFSTVVLLVVTAQVFFVGPQTPEQAVQVGENFFPQKSSAGGEISIPITEAVTFSGEPRSQVQDPRTIYILEQVSDSTDTRIVY